MINQILFEILLTSVPEFCNFYLPIGHHENFNLGHSYQSLQTKFLKNHETTTEFQCLLFLDFFQKWNEIIYSLLLEVLLIRQSYHVMSQGHSGIQHQNMEFWAKALSYWMGNKSKNTEKFVKNYHQLKISVNKTFMSLLVLVFSYLAKSAYEFLYKFSRRLVLNLKSYVTMLKKQYQS